MRAYELVMMKLVFLLVIFLGLFQFQFVFYNETPMGVFSCMIFVLVAFMVSFCLVGEMATALFAFVSALVAGKVLGFHITSLEFTASVAIVSMFSTMASINLWDTNVPVKSLKHGQLSAWIGSGIVGVTVFATMIAFHEVGWYSLSFAMCGFLSLTAFHFWSKLNGWGEKIEPVVEAKPISETSVASSTEAPPEQYVEPTPQIVVEP